MAELNTAPQSRGRRRTSRKLPTRVDLTAMVDLAFLLITFFMLTTVLSKPKAMPAVMPVPGPPGNVPESSTMTICLGKNNRAVWYLGLPDKPLITPTETGYGNALGKAIANTQSDVFKRSHKGLFVIIKPSDHSRFENLTETLDDMKIYGVPGYAIAKLMPQDVGMLKEHNIY